MHDVIVTPRMSGDLFGHYEALVSAFIDNFQRFNQGRPELNVVDKAAGFVPSTNDPESPQE